MKRALILAASWALMFGLGFVTAQRSGLDQREWNVKTVEDPAVLDYVNRVGQNLSRNSDAKIPFTIRVVDSKDIVAIPLSDGLFLDISDSHRR